MKQYFVTITEQAFRDIDGLIQYIREECLAPDTAEQYYSGLMTRIYWLAYGADVLPEVSYSKMMFHTDGMRRINYKNVALFYKIEGSIVYVYRIMPQKMVKFS